MYILKRRDFKKINSMFNNEFELEIVEDHEENHEEAGNDKKEY
jgi:hypothetical protein